MAMFIFLLLGLFYGTQGKVDFKYQDCMGYRDERDKKSTEIPPTPGRLKTDSSPNKVIHVDSAHLNPYPVQIPGDLTGDIVIQAPRLVTGNHYKLDISIHKHVLFWIPVPCIAKVGSCSYDFCELVGNFKKDNVTRCPQQLVDQGLPCTCPFQPGTYTLKPAVFKIPTLTFPWSWIASGDYKVDAKLTDTNTGEQVGCYHVEVTATDPPKKCSGFGCIFG